MPYTFVLRFKRRLHSFGFHRLLHWDVNNENLHGDFFERHTTDPDITHKMFQWIHSIDPSIKLFLNDYSVLPVSTMTTVRTNTSCLSKVNWRRYCRQIHIKIFYFFSGDKKSGTEFHKKPGADREHWSTKPFLHH